MSADLPFDFHRAPGRARRAQSHVFTLPQHPGSLDPYLIAAFGLLLARYAGQQQVTLSLGRGDGHGEHGGPRVLQLELAQGRRCSQLVAQARELTSDRVTAAHEQLAAAGAEADLALRVLAGDAPRAELVYDASLFKPSSVERMAGHLEVLLTSLREHPEALVTQLPLLSPGELRWLERECDGAVRALAPALVHELIAEQARVAPQASALRFGQETLSYRELDRRAERLARYLAARGIGRGCHVVVCVEPSFDAVVSLLGILKAGAVYVPLDPTYPDARVRAILDDTRPALVLSQPHLRARLPAAMSILTLDCLPEGDDAAVLPAVDLAQPAYVFYTSGTTGTPKGVVASVRNLRHYVRSVEQRYQLGPADVVPAIARFSFSISLFELLAPLVAGGTVLLLERAHVVDPARMARTLSEVTLFHAGPGLLRGLLAHVRRSYREFSAFDGVRHASSGGDMVPPELLESLKEVFGQAEVFVIYGASELSCMGCTYPVPRERVLTRTFVGRPFDNVSVRVLDAAGNVLPAGVVGEIHFAGDGVVSGYLNRPELTAEKFIQLAGKRFYRTGDQGRLSDDGQLEMLGRNDYQVKLRGMRVELGEVEHALRRAPGVVDAVSATREDSEGEKTLVAYVVTDGAGEKAARISAIRRYLVEQLPDYMVPGVYVELERLPVNHNLKVDRRALPQPQDADFRASAGASRAPRTPTEQVLAGLWQQLLSVQQVGVDDNFFELGGHSLLALKLSLETERALGVPLTGMDVLREPLAVLAAICDRQRGVVPPAPPPTPFRSNAAAVELLHFGPQQSLYGVLHGRTSNATNAALLCAPVGQEGVRARFVLTQLAKRLARSGVPSLMFDYFGCGDSLGESRDGGPSRWSADIVVAHAELRRRTGCTRVSALGVRLGALLLAAVAPELELTKLVLWDAVTDGQRHRRRLEQLQRAYARDTAPLRFWRQLRLQTPAGELLGTHFSPRALRELEALKLGPLLGRQRCPVQQVDFACSWEDLACLEDVIPDLDVSRALAEQLEGRA